MHSKEDYMTVDEVCDLLHITRNSLYRWGSIGTLKPIAKVGRRNFYLKKDVYALLNPKVGNSAEGE